MGSEWVTCLHTKTNSLFDQVFVMCWAWIDTIQNKEGASSERITSQKIILMKFLEIEKMDAEQENIFNI